MITTHLIWHLTTAAFLTVASAAVAKTDSPVAAEHIRCDDNGVLEGHSEERPNFDVDSDVTPM